MQNRTVEIECPSGAVMFIKERNLPSPGKLGDPILERVANLSLNELLPWQDVNRGCSPTTFDQGVWMKEARETTEITTEVFHGPDGACKPRMISWNKVIPNSFVVRISPEEYTGETLLAESAQAFVPNIEDADASEPDADIDLNAKVDRLMGKIAAADADIANLRLSLLKKINKIDEKVDSVASQVTKHGSILEAIRAVFAPHIRK